MNLTSAILLLVRFLVMFKLYVLVLVLCVFVCNTRFNLSSTAFQAYCKHVRLSRVFHNKLTYLNTGVAKNIIIMVYLSLNIIADRPL